MTTSTIVLGLYAGIAFLASLAGGSLPSLIRLTHTRLQTALSFIAGLMLGMAMLHLLPHAAGETHSVDRAVGWALGGFLAMFFLQRVFHHHQHEGPAEGASASDPSGCCGHTHRVDPAPHSGSASTGRFSWVAVALGMTLHSLIDGLALAAAVVAVSQTAEGLVGLGTALAVVLHKPFDALSVLTLMKTSGCGTGLKRAANVGLALMTPLGVILAALGFGTVAEANHEVLGCALGFCAGGFLCIAASDLLPELHFHSHDRLRLSLALMAGLGVSILVGAFEGHNHGNDGGHGADDAHMQQPAHPDSHAH